MRGRDLLLFGSARAAFNPVPLFRNGDAGMAYLPRLLGEAHGEAVAAYADASPNGWNLAQGTAANRPLCDITSGVKSLLFDGTNDDLRITSGPALDVFRNRAFGTIIAAVKVAADGALRGIFHTSTNAGAASARASMRKQTTGNRFTVTSRRLDADSVQESLATGAADDTWIVITNQYDWANGGQSCRKNLATAETFSPSWGAAAASENTAALSINLGSFSTGSFMSGRIGPVIAIARQLPDDELAWAIRGVGAEVKLTF